ncbi:CAP domain-containing protein [Rhodobacteraceae bacterium D3-12]|nr:CAP domain-containing protein [Rhodobacteraceae bacterium D3-12]
MRLLAATLAAAIAICASVLSAEPVREVVQLTNAFRAQNGLGALAISPVLEAVAEGHGRDMAKKGFFSHKGSNGSSVGKRAKRKGYRFCLIAENIAKGQRTPQEVMQSWITSKGHRSNMLQRKAREIGVIREAGNIWVMVIGSPRGGC